MIDKIFVYGTLMRGLGLNWCMRTEDDEVCDAYIEGDYGMATYGSYPMIYRFKHNPSIVMGELHDYELRAPRLFDGILQTLDSIEIPAGYERVVVDVHDGYDTVKAYTYIYTGNFMGACKFCDDYQDKVYSWRHYLWTEKMKQFIRSSQTNSYGQKETTGVSSPEIVSDKSEQDGQRWRRVRSMCRKIRIGFDTYSSPIQRKESDENI